MPDFENDFLKKYTPCNYADDASLIDALARVHVEFVMIHPFREGNGRIARVLTTLMALQAGKPLLNYSVIQLGKGKQEYFKAIQSGWDREYDPMKKVVAKILKKTVSDSAVK